MLHISDLIFTLLWRVIRILVPDRDPPGFIQRAVDRVSSRDLKIKNEARRRRLNR